MWEELGWRNAVRETKEGLKRLVSQISHLIFNTAFIIFGSGGITLPTASIFSDYKRGER